MIQNTIQIDTVTSQEFFTMRKIIVIEYTVIGVIEIFFLYSNSITEIINLLSHLLKNLHS